MKSHDRHTGRRGLGWIAIPALALIAAASCKPDEVLNPGPTNDTFLDSLNAHQALVTGATRDLAFAMQNIGYWGAALTFELNPAGSTGSFGIPPSIQDGRFEVNFTGDWNQAQVARFTAENALDRFQRVLPLIAGAPDFSSYAPAAGAALVAGYANRLMGENFCQVVFNQPDGSPGTLQPHTAAFTRAEGFFTQARTIATAAGETDMATAATAGLASVLALQGRWSEAASEASTVANSFVYELPFSDQEQSQFNFIHFANGNEPYRAHTVWGTWFEEYENQTGDPRTPWRVGVCADCPDPNNPTGDAGVEKFGGNVPWFTQLKFDERSSPINLSSGWEMRLIEAEAALETGDFNGAAALMNQRRQALDDPANGVNLPDLAPTTLDEGWAFLKQERAVELWMEGRRMGDVRRWLMAGTPGALNDAVYLDLDSGGVNDDPRERVTDAGHHLAYPVGESERETNPNVTDNPTFDANLHCFAVTGS